MIAVHDNALWAGAAPRLSVLIPFYRDDPVRLLTALASNPVEGVEIVILNDGSGDANLAANVARQTAVLPLPVRFIDNGENQGRAAGRNRLAANARGEWLLFLDSDMLPDTPSFLKTYVALIEAQNPAIVFGGFSLDQAPAVRHHALHRAMALKSDCTPADQRAKAPEKHVFTSNLLVRRDVFEAEPFDAGFAGWGWEDVEWAMRAGRRYPIAHIHNTATHLGLDTAAVIAGKYEQSAANFARVVAAHPDIVAGYPSYRVARLLKRAPFSRVWRPMLKTVALAESLPVRLRDLAMRLYRAALYAEVV